MLSRHFLRSHQWLRRLVVPVALVTAALLGARSAHAATLTVTNLNDTGAGSLRERIAIAAAGDTINFASTLSGTIKLTAASGQLPIAKNLTIQGPGAAKLTISGENATRVFGVSGGIVSISGLTIANGRVSGDGAGFYVTGVTTVTLNNCVLSGHTATSDGAAIDAVSGSKVTLNSCSFANNTAGNYGGAIESASSTLTANNCSFASNVASNGGAIWSNTNTTLNGCTFTGNRAQTSGGLSLSGTAVVNACTLVGNAATSGNGGGIGTAATLTVSNSTISGNDATNFGGGIYANEPTFIKNSTISGNTAGEGAGVYLYVASTDTAEIKNATITANASRTSGGGVRSTSIVTKVASSIIAGNSAVTAAPDVSGNFTSQGFNLIGKSDGSTAFTQATDKKGTVASPLDAKLGALTNNGGPTQTHALLSGSPALDAGKNASEQTTDQRGLARIVDQSGIVNAAGGDGSDIGAYELLPTVRITVADLAQAEGNSGPTTFAFTVTLSTNPSMPVSVNYATAVGGTTPATSGDDFVPTSGTLTFQPGGALTQKVNVIINGDTSLEGNETFLVNLSAPQNATIGDAQAIGTINNDDVSGALPRLTITDVSGIEGNVGRTHLVFTVNVLEPRGQQISVAYATAIGTASTADFVTTSGTLVIPAGATFGTIVVPVLADTLVEANETFKVNLSAPVNATIPAGFGSGTGTIRNDDVAVATLGALSKMIQPQMTANTSTNSITLRPVGPIEAENIAVEVNGEWVQIAEVQTQGDTLTLLLDTDTLRASDSVTVVWINEHGEEDSLTAFAG